MSEDELTTRYFNWLVSLVATPKCGTSGSRRSYRSLLWHMFLIPFYYRNPLDANRYSDGIDIRYRFGYVCAYDDSVIASTIDTRDCSVLEMLVALAFRCEEQIMSNSKYGDRTGVWFWDMIENLGLYEYTDDEYIEEDVDDILERFMELQYAPDGFGGLFVITDAGDIRGKDIWWQLNRYLLFRGVR